MRKWFIFPREGKRTIVGHARVRLVDGDMIALTDIVVVAPRNTSYVPPNNLGVQCGMVFDTAHEAVSEAAAYALERTVALFEEIAGGADEFTREVAELARRLKHLPDVPIQEGDPILQPDEHDDGKQRPIAQASTAAVVEGPQAHVGQER